MAGILYNFPGAGNGDLPTAPGAAVASCGERFAEEASCAPTSGTTYYVSSATGSDSNAGTTEATPLQTIAAVNALALQPGDRVLFHCGDLWRGEELIISKSGAACANIIYATYPELEACAEPPTLLGSEPVTGFVEDASNVWVANLSSAENQTRFPNGLNQVFAGNARLPIGRWPNLDDSAFPGGWAHMDDGGSFIKDADLPDTDWTDAIARAKSIRWLLLSRKVTGSEAGRITLNDDIGCWGVCGAPTGSTNGYGWGYHLVNHRATLDQPGEWYYDEQNKRLYVVSSSEPTSIEASPIPADVANPDDPRFRAGINLGTDLAEPISYVVVEGLRVKNHFNMGIAAPVNFKGTDNHHLTIRCNTVTDPEQIGMSFSTWIFDCVDCTDDWYGGTNLTVAENFVSGANRHGVLSRSDDSVFQGNEISGIGLLPNLGKQGLWCGFEGSNCTENGDGWHIVSGTRSSFVGNRMQSVGYCGFDVFGSNMLFEGNVIDKACSTKGDCGAIRTFGRDNFTSTPAHDLTIRDNLITNVLGVTDGDNSDFAELFGFGLYIDSFSRDVLAEGNTIVDASVAGILYQNSRGSIVDNLVVNHQGRQNVALSGETTIAAFTGNQLVALAPSMLTLAAESGSPTTSDNNVFFSPYREASIGGTEAQTLASWQSSSGQDANSAAAWYQLSASDAPNVEVFLNDTAAAKTVTLDGSYFDLSHISTSGTVTIGPFSGVALVKE